MICHSPDTLQKKHANKRYCIWLYKKLSSNHGKFQSNRECCKANWRTGQCTVRFPVRLIRTEPDRQRQRCRFSCNSWKWSAPTQTQPATASNVQAISFSNGYPGIYTWRIQKGKWIRDIIYLQGAAGRKKALWLRGFTNLTIRYNSFYLKNRLNATKISVFWQIVLHTELSLWVQNGNL